MDQLDGDQDNIVFTEPREPSSEIEDCKCEK
jgi:hypothetical protein